MSLTINTKAYQDDTQRSPDSFRYTGPDQTFSNADYLDLKRTAPKVTATSAGKARSMAKFTRTLTNGTDPVGTGIIDLSSSIPVGADVAEVTALLNDLAAFAASPEALKLVLELDIRH